MLNIIDISSWQGSMDLSAVLEENPTLDGAITKTTEGTGYMNPYAAEWIKILQSLGRPFGFYHFLNLEEPEAQADWFVNASRQWFGEGIPVLDYEAEALDKGTAWLKRALDQVYHRTGVKPMVYCSQSVLQQKGWQEIVDAGYELWMAQYADMKYTYIVETPWHGGSIAPYDKYRMHQYSSRGRLFGYSGDLDLNKFYGSIEDWNRIAKGERPEESTTIEVTVKRKLSPKVIADVLDGKYGIGPARKRKLARAGYNPDEVQSKINELYNLAEKIKMEVGKNKNYADLIFRIGFGGY